MVRCHSPWVGDLPDMYVTKKMVEEMISRYGKPEEVSFEFATPDEEFRFIKSTQKYERAHDATVYAIKDGEIIVIAKHFYPPGLYRAPSGGLQPDESFHDGIAREITEETGTSIEIEHFLLQSQVTFTNDLGTIPWTSYVFQARYISGDFDFTDVREIREVRTARLEEFMTFGTIMRKSDRGGLHYRAALHEAVEPLLRL